MRQKWIYLSFVGTNGFLGASYVSSNGTQRFMVNDLPKESIEQIAIIAIPQKMVHKVPKNHKYHNRILSKQELYEAENGEIVNSRGEAIAL